MGRIAVIPLKPACPVDRTYMPTCLAPSISALRPPERLGRFAVRMLAQQADILDQMRAAAAQARQIAPIAGAAPPQRKRSPDLGQHANQTLRMRSPACAPESMSAIQARAHGHYPAAAAQRRSWSSSQRLRGTPPP
jgi:hypothetical protein